MDCEFASPDGPDEPPAGAVVGNEYSVVDDESPRRVGRDHRNDPPEEEESHADSESGSSQGCVDGRPAARRTAAERRTLRLPSSVSKSFLPKKLAKAKALFDERPQTFVGS